MDQATVAPIRSDASAPDMGQMLEELEDLVNETFALWSHKRVGFSWRNYYDEHTTRVRAHCRNLSAHEGADAELLDFAALLHDITKRYDGPFITGDDGKRVVDHRGLWVCDTIHPDLGGNIVTALYEFYDEFREPHNESGADIAHALLMLKGASHDFASAADDVIRAHLLPIDGQAPAETLTIEQQILRDTDLIDANFGLVSFYRNVQIHVHRRVEETGVADLRAYVEYVPNWLNSKYSFFDKMHTAEALRRAEERQERCFAYHRLLQQEVAENFDLCRRFGLLGVFGYFMSTIADPDFFAELAWLEQSFLPEREAEAKTLAADKQPAAFAALERVRQFCRELRQEAEGEM